MIIAGDAFAESVARIGGWEFVELLEERFPDGEQRFKLGKGEEKSIKGSYCALVLQGDCSQLPSDYLFSVLICKGFLERLGARKIFLVIPYLPFARQDKEPDFSTGIGDVLKLLLSGRVEKLICFDSHFSNSGKSFSRVKSVSAVPALAEAVGKRFSNSVVVAPDDGATGMARELARELKTKFLVMEKKRLNPRRVAVRFSGKQKLSGKSAIIVDDAISTGGTIIAAARELKKLGTKRVLALVAHFTRGAWESDAVNKLKKEGILLKCTNSIKSKASEAGVAGLIAKALKNC